MGLDKNQRSRASTAGGKGGGGSNVTTYGNGEINEVRVAKNGRVTTYTVSSGKVYVEDGTGLKAMPKDTKLTSVIKSESTNGASVDVFRGDKTYFNTRSERERQKSEEEARDYYFTQRNSRR